MKSFKKVLLVGMALATVSIFGACSNGTDVITKAVGKQPVKEDAESELLNEQKETAMTTSERNSIKYEDATSSQKRYISSTEAKKIKEGMTYTDILNAIDYGGDTLKYYKNNEKRAFYTEKDTDGTYEIMVELNKHGYVVNIERTEVDNTVQDNEISTQSSEEPVKTPAEGYEEKNDRVPWYKDVNNNSAEVYYSDYLKIKKGMPANDVKATIGQPRMIEKYKSYSVYGYTGYGGEGSLRVIFEPNGTVTKVVEDGLPRS
ncbi:TPA: hypothetical protein QCY19_003229 [Bacillus luti]|nr:hypothetical protein [Bacillus luti]